jgi:hypothetical protein
MAKKKDIQPAQPVISSLPLPATDNPLVIDLPDGQKLVVGKMETGTVIEVATWRGTGRPDSRTSRLMLGMSSSSEAQQSTNSDQNSSNGGQGQEKSNKYVRSLKALLAKATEFLGFSSSNKVSNSTVSSEEKNSKRRIGRGLKLNIKTPRPRMNLKGKKKDDLEDPDFQNWLDSISKKNSKLTDFSPDSKEAKAKIELIAKSEVKAPVKRVAKKATPKNRRSR